MLLNILLFVASVMPHTFLFHTVPDKRNLQLKVGVVMGVLK